MPRLLPVLIAFVVAFAPLPARAGLPGNIVAPIADCVVATPTLYTVRFGYENIAFVPVSRPITPENNIFIGGNVSPAVGQPTVFDPGRHYDVFRVTFDPSEAPSYAWVLDGQLLRIHPELPHCPYTAVPRTTVFAQCASRDIAAGGATVRFGYLNASAAPVSYVPPHTFNRMGVLPVTHESSQRGQPATLVPGFVAEAVTVQFDPVREAGIAWTFEGETAFATPGIAQLPPCGPGARIEVSGSGQLALPGAALAAPLGMRLLDASGAPMPGRQLRLRTAGPVAVGTEFVTTDADGNASVGAAAMGTIGTGTVYVEVVGISLAATLYVDVVASLPPPDALFANSFE